MGTITRRIANDLTLGTGRVLLNTTTITTDTGNLDFNSSLIIEQQPNKNIFFKTNVLIKDIFAQIKFIN